MRPYSTSTPPSDSNRIYKFYLHSVPPYSVNLFFTGTQAMNYDIVMPELAIALSLYGSRQVRFRLGFRVLDIPALDQQISDKGPRILLLLDYIKCIAKDVPFHNEGIEFTFGPEVVKVLVQMINDVLVNQGKKPEEVHIQISC